MTRLVFDLETNGLLNKLDRIHSLVIYNPDTKQMFSACDGPGYTSARGEVISLLEGIAMLADADTLIGHNIVRFDIPVLVKLYPHIAWREKEMFDTLLMSMLCWPDIKINDMGQVKAKKANAVPGKMIGKYALEAWGHRLGQHKGDYAKECKDKGIDPWAEWSADMQRYGEQDVCVTVMLYDRILNMGFPANATKMEHEFLILDQARQEYGFRFDEVHAQKVYAELCGHRARLEDELRSLFDGWFHPGKLVTPKKTLVYKDPMRPDRTADAPFVAITFKEFNPANRNHVADRLQKVWGWEPKEYTKSGEPKLDDMILSELDWPEAKKLSEYYMVNKRIGQLAEGAKAWLKYAKDGRLHGRITTVGAVTRRCTHHDPNLSQCPATKVPYGAEFRSCFIADEGMLLLGIDASGLELRCLAHYLVPYDGGAYAKAVVEGKEAEGTDVHSMNAKALGFDPKKLYVVNGKHTSGRDLAKRFIYAFLYGAGDYKIGVTVGLEDGDIEQLQVDYPDRWLSAKGTLKFKGLPDTPSRRAMVVKGAVLKDSFLDKTPALKKLREELAEILKHRSHIYTIDGARMPIRHKHAVLNTLLQSTGAIVVKYATVNLAKRLKLEGLEWGTDWAMVMHSHDEMQITALPDLKEQIGEAGREEITKAGEQLGFLCTLDGDWKYGASWKDTH